MFDVCSHKIFALYCLDLLFVPPYIIISLQDQTLSRDGFAFSDTNQDHILASAPALLQSSIPKHNNAWMNSFKTSRFFFI